jgi:hypothetical protein
MFTIFEPVAQVLNRQSCLFHQPQIKSLDRDRTKAGLFERGEFTFLRGSVDLNPSFCQAHGRVGFVVYQLHFVQNTGSKRQVPRSPDDQQIEDVTCRMHAFTDGTQIPIGHIEGSGATGNQLVMIADFEKGDGQDENDQSPLAASQARTPWT